MKERFGRSDYRFILTCLVLFVAAIFYSAHNFYRAFPEASIDFRVDRDGGRSLAEQFLTGRQYTLSGYRQASRFDFDENAKTFLEREAGLEQANLLMSSRIRMWRWEYRWFQPRNKEEYRADVTVTGDIAGFEHELPEDAARPAATPETARTLAEDFLRTGMHHDPAGLEFVEVNETARPHRIDRAFTWKERDFNLHDATYRVEVTMLGNEVGGFREYLKVPEQWQRDFERLRSKNTIAETVDSAVLVALLAGMLVLLVLRTRRQDVRWRGAAIVGVIGTALALCAQLNSPAPLRIRLPHHRFLLQLSVARVHQRAAHGSGVGRIPVPHDGGFRAALPRNLPGPNLTRQSLPLARLAHQALLQRRHSRHHPHRHLHRVSDRLLHRGVAPGRLGAGRRPL